MTELVTNASQLDNNLLVSSLVQSSARNVDTDLGVKEDFAVHKCRTIDPPTQLEPITEKSVFCSGCNRSLRSPGDLMQAAQMFTRENKAYF